MNDQASTPGAPAVVDRATFGAELDKLRAREKAHTREGDAIAAARLRLPMVEVDSDLAQRSGPTGRSPCSTRSKDAGSSSPITPCGGPERPAPEQCEGCTLFLSQIARVVRPPLA